MDKQFDFQEHFKDDHFNRCTTAENLTNIFMNSQEGLILSINSPWGTGKSKFLEMWKNGLDNTSEFRTIVLNAWEADYFNDPLFALLLATEEYSNNIDNVDSSDIADAASSIISNLIKKGTFDAIDYQSIKKNYLRKEQKN